MEINNLTPVAGLFESQLMIVANNDFPASNPKELLAVLKANPGKYSYATSGIGTIHHLAFESMKARAGVFILHIPYRGASQLIPDLVNNQIQLGVVSAAAGRELTNAGRIKAVAMLTASEQSRKGTVPPMADVLPGFNVVPRHVLYAPAGIPAEAADRLAKAVKTVLAQPSIIAQVTQQGVAPAYRDPAELKPELIQQSKAWAALIKTQNIKLD
jgi:tripartite-type tricarboxylate transporter receptor subunit TctC